MPEAAAPSSILGLPADGSPTVVTVGTFDGVHRGHWGVLREIGARARASSGRSVLVTFDPHPLRVVRPAEAPSLLTTRQEKKEVLVESGLDYVVFLRFTERLRDYTPHRFVDEILLSGVGMTELVIGHDHGFGRGRSGDVTSLRTIAEQRGFGLDVVHAVRDDGGAVSSSRIRRALREGRLDEANQALGRFYSLRGNVVKGDGRGTGIGFPTANLQVDHDEKLVPAAGIYACWAGTPVGRFMGALHIGPRPTFPGASSTVEVYLLDFDGDVYGREIRLDLVSRLRPVEPFESVEALVDQMRVDVEKTRSILGGQAQAAAL